MTFILLGSGPETSVPELDKMQEKYPAAAWIGVDRGVYNLLTFGIMPLMAFGDFDSITGEERQWVQSKLKNIEIYPKEKDETDMEIAINWCLRQNPSQIILLGATGGRLDHLFMNAHLILKGLKVNVPVYLEDRWNKITILDPGIYTFNKESFKYYSMLPFTEEVKGLTLQGFRYPLENKDIEQGSSLCISNELTAETGKVSFKTGRLYLFQSMDKA
ncbi:thiamine diphosphokinase [Salipaludibacillus aurantiacus]|uniref:Thiamine diphosphokinase n=1 Tax=Salipaludibacillus aurantiacus TaxID=1601833 RepID=A0A1H9QPM4_9BACI|nr:thiamine diphosphokinase [Salipaludibacillus aurantiacus]SER62412.1 thiamine pyrophosphokinase [Salipaludibacillus aurantiacus]